jgi:hypothetical protein
VSKGTDNDKLLCNVIGENWRELTRADYPRLNNKSAGYNHEEYWPNVVEKIKILAKNRNQNQNNIDSMKNATLIHSEYLKDEKDDKDHKASSASLSTLGIESQTPEESLDNEQFT